MFRQIKNFICNVFYYLNPFNYISIFKFKLNFNLFFFKFYLINLLFEMFRQIKNFICNVFNYLNPLNWNIFSIFFTLNWILILLYFYDPKHAKDTKFDPTDPRFDLLFDPIYKPVYNPLLDPTYHPHLANVIYFLILVAIWWLFCICPPKFYFYIFFNLLVYISMILCVCLYIYICENLSLNIYYQSLKIVGTTFFIWFFC